MIVLTEIQKNELEQLKALTHDKLIQEGIDIMPIPIKNDLYILPESVLEDVRLTLLFSQFNNYTIREVEQEEFINII